MSNKSRPIKTTRLFSLQLADHDNLFAPRQKPRVTFSWLKLVTFIAGFCFFLAPSFKIGQAILKSPAFKIPQSVTKGDLFTIPVDEDEDDIPQIGGRPLSYVDGKTPFYIGAALRPNDFEISIQFGDDDHPRIKGMIEKFRHPTYPLFVQNVHVTPATVAAAPTPVPRGTKIAPEDEPKAPPAFTSAENKVLARFDGHLRLRCWKEPSVEAVGIDPLKPRRHVHYGTMPAVGGGEVVFVGPSESEGNSDVLVYHGGGLFTRYWALKEVRVQKGSKVTAGQTIGHVQLAPPKHVTHPTWQPLMNVAGSIGEINPQSVLALSSRLCDSK